MIHKLSPLLGGRSEVMKLTLMEALGHMCMLKEKEKAEEIKEASDRYIHFLSMMYAHPTDDKKMAEGRREFVDSLRAKLPKPPPKKYEWNFDAIDQHTAKQNANLQKGG